MTRRSSNKKKQNRKTMAKPVPLKHETSTTSNAALDDDGASGSQSPTRNLQVGGDSTPSPSGVPPPSPGNPTPRENPIESMDVDEDPTPPAPIATKTRGGKRGGRAKQALEVHRVEGEMSLYQALFNDKSTPKEIVDKWILKYESNKDDGLRMLMQLFIDTSGCKSVITPVMLNLEHIQLISRMTQEFDQDNADYPLVKASAPFKKFKINYSMFVQCLVDQCKEHHLFDGFFMDYTISLLVGLSDSQVRAFRHTATLAVMKMLSALAEVAFDVAIDLEEAQMQCNTEREGEGNPDRMEALVTKATNLQQKWDELKNMLKYSFKAVFVARFRDVVPEIRAICIEEIGVCMVTFPGVFLEDSTLKYIGWLLTDSEGEVRLKSVQALQPLYDTEEWKIEMQDFTKHFRERLVAMIFDRDSNVGVQVVKLITFMKKYGHITLSDKEHVDLYELIYCANRALAQAAAQFVNEEFFTSNENFEMETKSGKKRSPNTPFIKDLVLLSIEAERPEHEPYLVDALIEINKMMKDWECMTDLLLEKPGPKEILNLDSQEETILIKIMACCIKQAVTGKLPAGRVSARKLSSKEKLQLREEQQKITQHFVGVLPLLLEKYHEDSEKLAHLISIPQHFDFDIYSADEQTPSLDLLMEKIINIVNFTINTDVLDEAAKTLEKCSESTISAKFNEITTNLINFIVDNYTQAMEKVTSAIEGGLKPCDLDVFSVQEGLTKIAIFFSCHNLNNADLWDAVFKNIRERVLPAEAIKYSINTCFFSLIWLLNELKECAVNDNLGRRQKYDTLKRRLRDFMKYAVYFIGTDDVSALIREEAYNSVCDLLVMFNGNRIDQSDSQLHQPVYEADVKLQQTLNKFVQQRVFTERQDLLDEKSKEQELHKNRNFLAGYCKLIINNVFSTEAAADIFKHYLEHGEVYGDIIKMTISRACDIDKTECALALQRGLIIRYNEFAERRVDTSNDDDKFTSMKELAKRFALFFGTDATKNREAMVKLHKQGIMFAASRPDGTQPRRVPPNLSYLEILNKFTNKLTNQDKKTVLNFLNRHLKVGTPEEEWKSLVLYRKVLNKADAPAIDMSASLEV